MNTAPERNGGTDRLGDLIRRTYSPPADLRAPADLASRVMRAAKAQPWTATWRDYLYWVMESQIRWIPASVGAAAVILAIGLALSPSRKANDNSSTTIAGTGEKPSPVTSRALTQEDPLGPDFFDIDEVVDEPVSVELADGWDYVTIEDEVGHTALVYFYSKDQINDSTGGAQPRTQ